ncbi:MAG: dephospho-CoA kinase [Waddliaceae bacterium]|jgi:dephospho-CoA kinase|nr:dephospho-CoA kinase [Waddliaceae bacterium]MBT3578954.1 dephospho-CoA kinase [Waddliaceae bacterium]MBT4445487.1 dephospho-CoA kinase [Waddliaceae bacterium]MBT6928978.1 dephospho-CoA kinase [Waddliaceae bacterium]MBT7264526.1 dephospho-CoA kinase [Waddliaceae bacterium]
MMTSKKIAVTGGIASGKSTVCRLFAECGAYTINSDTIVHTLLDTDSTLQKTISTLVGYDISTVERAVIAKDVFDDPQMLRRLEEILHPQVICEIKKQYNKVKNTEKPSLFVVEVPLLFEASHENFYDTVITVSTNDTTCRKRSKYDEEQYTKRMERQLDTKDKAAAADVVINNDGTIEDLRKQVRDCYDALVK